MVVVPVGLPRVALKSRCLSHFSYEIKADFSKSDMPNLNRDTLFFTPAEYHFQKISQNHLSVTHNRDIKKKKRKEKHKKLRKLKSENEYIKIGAGQ